MAIEVATLAAGCFWCVEPIFDDLNGVLSVENGYTGGRLADPTYRQICNGDTGHAEAVRVEYDPAVVSYDDILDIFFHIHDPTQLNRQENDIGTQYRSAIFPHTPEQQEAAVRAIARNQANWGQPVVTTVEPFEKWWPAEDYHQEYFVREGANNPYCMAVAAPKLAKFRKNYAARLKGAA